MQGLVHDLATIGYIIRTGSEILLLVHHGRDMDDLDGWPIVVLDYRIRLANVRKGLSTQNIRVDSPDPPSIPIVIPR